MIETVDDYELAADVKRIADTMEQLLGVLTDIRDAGSLFVSGLGQDVSYEDKD